MKPYGIKISWESVIYEIRRLTDNQAILWSNLVRKFHYNLYESFKKLNRGFPYAFLDKKSINVSYFFQIIYNFPTKLKFCAKKGNYSTFVIRRFLDMLIMAVV